MTQSNGSTATVPIAPPSHVIECPADDTEHSLSKRYARLLVAISVLGWVIFILGLLALFGVFNGEPSHWELKVISTQKSLSSDRATGAGLYDREAERTFIAYAGPLMEPYVMEFDHGTGTFVNELAVAKSKPGHDFHDYPRMVMADDGKLVVVFTNSPETLHMAKCDSPHTSFGNWTERQISDDNPTYPCLIKAPNGDLYTFYRSMKDTDYRPLHYIKSTDNGETWSEPRVGIDTNHQSELNLNEVYFDCPRLEPAYGNAPARFAMGWTMAGGGPGLVKHNNYHKDAHFAYFYPSNDTFAIADGTNLGSSIDLSELPSTVVFDSGPLDESNKRIVDYYFAPSYIGDSHQPLVVFNFNNTVFAAQWTGAEWEQYEVTSDAAYNLFDLEKLGPSSFRLFHPQRDVRVFVTSDSGKTWVREHRVQPSEGSASKVIKILDSHPDLPLVAHESNWTLYHDDEDKSVNYVGTYRIWSMRFVNP